MVCINNVGGFKLCLTVNIALALYQITKQLLIAVQIVGLCGVLTVTAQALLADRSTLEPKHQCVRLAKRQDIL